MGNMIKRKLKITSPEDAMTLGQKMFEQAVIENHRKYSTKNPRIKVSSAKAKSRRCQDWTAAKISDLIGLPWGKDQPIEPRGMGQTGVDIRLDREALAKFPHSVECKWNEKWDVPGAIRQAKANQMSGTQWLLVMTKNQEIRGQSEKVVILDAEVFFQLLALIPGERKGL
uniref:Uncharacterized protein n=2 Tax=viral metagenome TaxID=1070528 RepID=A0A6M3IL25_9ZZZZ